MKYHIEKNTVQETLILPLYGRKLCSERFPGLFSDPESARLIESIDYDFSEKGKKMETTIGLFGAVEVAQRQYDLAYEVSEYLRAHPNAAVVNLGCGLDTTFYRVDNGSCKGYNIDMPDVIAVRNELLPPRERERNIACDLNDTSWFDEIDGSEGAIFFAAGVFYYFKNEQVKALITAMSERFEGGTAVFDTCNRRGVKMMMKTWLKEAGITDVSAFFAVSDPEREIGAWSDKIAVSSKPYMCGYRPLGKSVRPLYRFLSKFGDNNVAMKIVKVAFVK